MLYFFYVNLTITMNPLSSKAHSLAQTRQTKHRTNRTENQHERATNRNLAILVPRGRAPFGQHQESRPLAFTAVKRLGTRVNTRVIYTLPVTFPLPPTKFPWSTSATRAISVLSSIILPLQTFFSRVLLLRQQPF